MNEDHAITIGYDPTKKTWDLVDANTFFSQRNKNIEQITDLIFEAYRNEGSIILGSKIFCLADSKKAMHYKKAISEWQNTEAYRSAHNPREYPSKMQNIWLKVAIG